MSPPAVFNLFVVRLVNRILSGFSAAKLRLAKYANKVIAVYIGPFHALYRFGSDGSVEPVGQSINDSTNSIALSLVIPSAILPRLLLNDKSTLQAISFTGDSELAADLSSLISQMEWDAEEDLSRVMGDMAAHHVVSAAHNLHLWGSSTRERIYKNVAEYLVEEAGAHLSQRELETLMLASEAMRDDIARLEARLNKLIQTS